MVNNDDVAKQSPVRGPSAEAPGSIAAGNAPQRPRSSRTAAITRRAAESCADRVGKVVEVAVALLACLSGRPTEQAREDVSRRKGHWLGLRRRGLSREVNERPDAKVVSSALENGEAERVLSIPTQIVQVPFELVLQISGVRGEKDSPPGRQRHGTRRGTPTQATCRCRSVPRPAGFRPRSASGRPARPSLPTRPPLSVGPVDETAEGRADRLLGRRLHAACRGATATVGEATGCERRCQHSAFEDDRLTRRVHLRAAPDRSGRFVARLVAPQAGRGGSRG